MILWDWKEKAMRRTQGGGRSGFTLIEMVIVVAIISVVAGIIVPAAGAVIRRAKVSRTGVDLRAIRTATIQAFDDMGTVPSDGSMGGNPLIKNSFYIKNDWGFSGWNGPYYEGSTESAFRRQFRFDNDNDTHNGNSCSGINIFQFITSGDQETAREIDKKIDDGEDATGRFRTNGCWAGGNMAGYSAGKKFSEP